MKKINQYVLMSGADYFSDNFAINAYMDSHVPVDIAKAKAEHAAIKELLESVGVEVTQVAAPEACQDGVYTANWALCRNKVAILSALPNKRKGEEPYAYKVLDELGFKLLTVPEGMKFSGQGDALPCGNYLFAGSVYRTDPEVHAFLASALGYEVISLQTKPLRRFHGWGPAVINETTGWPDSYYYDIDLALAVIRDDLIAWCPEAFVPQSVKKIRALPIKKIEVSLKEAQKAFACNLVSTGEAVVMSAYAPKLKSQLEKRGLKVLTPPVQELGKGGGYIRCTTLTLDNN